MAEGLEGGFSAVYPMLRALEEAGRIRRGYFVDGLGAAQFALAGALDRLRAVREPAAATGDAPEVHLLAAADPANPYGAAVPWPRRGETDRRPLPARRRRLRSCSSTGSPRCTSIAAAAPSRPCPRSTTPRSRPRRCGALRGLLADGRPSRAGRQPRRRRAGGRARRGTKRSCGAGSSRAIAGSSCAESGLGR